MNRLNIFLPLAIVLVAATNASAQRTLYVNATTGNDSFSKAGNSASSPWRTIGRAAWGSTNRSAPNAAEAASAGDTVMITGGTYTTSVAVNNRWAVIYNPVNAGTQSSPITFVCVGSCILGSPNGNGPVMGSDGQAYVRWYADISQGHAWRINAYGRQNGTPGANEVNTSPDTGPVVCHATTGCTVEGATIDGGLQTDYTDNWDGIRFENCTSCTARNNTIRNFRNMDNTGNGTGIKLYGSANAIIERNFVTQVGSAIAIKDQSAALPQSNVRVRFNKFDGADRCFSTSTTSEDRNYYYQNLCLNAQLGLHITGGGFSNEWYFNNTFVNLSNAGVMVASPLGLGGRFWNNIVVKSASAVYINGVMPTDLVVDLEHNLYFTFTNFYTGTDGNRNFTNYLLLNLTQDQLAPASRNVNPLFANASGADYRLCTGAGAPVASCSGASPAMTLGIDLFDLNGNGSTSDSIRAGAYVTNNETFGPSAAGPQSPSAPTNLRVVGQ